MILGAIPAKWFSRNVESHLIAVDAEVDATLRWLPNSPQPAEEDIVVMPQKLPRRLEGVRCMKTLFDRCYCPDQKATCA